MIKQCTNTEDIISLWSEIFGDTREEIEFFINNIQHAICLGYYLDNELASMLFLVDCNIKMYSAKYIYAASTKKCYEGLGYMTELIKYCKKDECLICLIPANDDLINFYKARGFISKTGIEHISFDENERITEYLLEGYHLTEPQVMIYERSKDGLRFFS